MYIVSTQAIAATHHWVPFNADRRFAASNLSWLIWITSLIAFLSVANSVYGLSSYGICGCRAWYGQQVKKYEKDWASLIIVFF
jgi:hypothetical protein